MGMGKPVLEPQILKEAELLMEHMEAEGVVDPSSSLATFTSNNILQMMFGQRWKFGETANKIFIDAINTLNTNTPFLMLGDLAPMLRHLSNVKRASKEFHEALDHIRSFIREMIEKQIAKTDSDLENADNTKVLLQTTSKDDLSTLVDLCQDIFLAGTGSTITTLNFVIVHLLNNPVWQEELFLEISTAFQAGVPSMGGLDKLPKLEATIQETLRLNPNAPLIPKATGQVTKVRGYVVPANCQVWVNVYHINYDPVTFPDPSTFSPQRWLRHDGTFRRE